MHASLPAYLLLPVTWCRFLLYGRTAFHRNITFYTRHLCWFGTVLRDTVRRYPTGRAVPLPGRRTLHLLSALLLCLHCADYRAIRLYALRAFYGAGTSSPSAPLHRPRLSHYSCLLTSFQLRFVALSLAPPGTVASFLVVSMPHCWLVSCGPGRTRMVTRTSLCLVGFSPPSTEHQWTLAKHFVRFSCQHVWASKDYLPELALPLRSPHRPEADATLFDDRRDTRCDFSISLERFCGTTAKRPLYVCPFSVFYLTGLLSTFSICCWTFDITSTYRPTPAFHYLPPCSPLGVDGCTWICWYTLTPVGPPVAGFLRFLPVISVERSVLYGHHLPHSAPACRLFTCRLRSLTCQIYRSCFIPVDTSSPFRRANLACLTHVSPSTRNSSISPGARAFLYYSCS